VKASRVSDLKAARKESDPRDILSFDQREIIIVVTCYPRSAKIRRTSSVATNLAAILTERALATRPNRTIEWE